MEFRKATKAAAKARVALTGPSGSGKSYSSLAIATSLGKPIALIDTERGSASKYADIFDFETLELANFDPREYIKAIQLAGRHFPGGTLIIDSLSHAWMGAGGALEQVDRIAKKSGNKFTAWGDVTPLHNALIDAIISAPMHVIATMRSKTEFVLEDVNGKKNVPRKVGTTPIQRDGMEFEFDIVGDLTAEHDLTISKTRCRALDNKTFREPGAELAGIIRAWLDDGTVPADTKAACEALRQQFIGAPSAAAHAAVGDTIRAAEKRGDISQADRVVLLDEWNKDFERRKAEHQRRLRAEKGAAQIASMAKSGAPTPVVKSAPSGPEKAPSREPGEDG
jgi:hypothetical protein